jgi:hypothetical protein
MMQQQKKELQKGDQVRIKETYRWAKNATGTVQIHPLRLKDIYSSPSKIFREVPSLHGIVKCYWVEFDIPQRDSDGDGPYSSAEIESEYLEIVNKD